MADRYTLVLIDILISARLAVNYISKLTWTNFLGNIIVQDAVIRRLEIMGLAARTLPPEIHEELPQIPWYELEQITKSVSEDYDTVNIAFVWDVVHNELPQWLEKLEVILPDATYPSSDP